MSGTVDTTIQLFLAPTIYINITYGHANLTHLTGHILRALDYDYRLRSDSMICNFFHPYQWQSRGRHL